MKSAKLEALQKQIQSGQLKHTKDKILAYAKTFGFFTLRDITKDLGIPRGTAAGRVSELEDEGLVKNWFGIQVKGFKDKQGHYSYLKDPKNQRIHKAQRMYERRRKWIQYGIREGFLDDQMKVVL